MKPTPLSLTLAAVAFCTSVQARPDKAVPEKVASLKPVEAGPYELKNRSAFHAAEEARIPFWPLGFQRPAKGVTVAAGTAGPQPKIQIEPRHFNVSSILLGNPALATINGRSFGEGEMLPVIFGSERLRVVVRRIHDGIVTLGYEGQEIQVPMRRPELGAKQAQAQAKPTDFVIQIGSPGANAPVGK